MDLRIKTALFSELQRMLDGGMMDNELIDTSKYTTLFVSHSNEIKIPQDVVRKLKQEQKQNNAAVVNREFLEYLLLNTDIFKKITVQSQNRIIKMTVDEIGITQVKPNRAFITKFILIKQHLNNINCEDFNSSHKEKISSYDNPIKRLIKRFQKTLHLLVHGKVKNQLNDLGGKGSQDTDNFTESELQVFDLNELVTEKAQERFRWLLDRCVDQI